MINNMTTDGAVVMAVSAEVLFHDGANWVRLDQSTTNGSNGLSTIQLIKTAVQDFSFRIVAIRNMDNKRIVDQTIFHRLKYKEATPMFHQWRNEHRQVIGLNFPKEQDARHFYSAVRQALDSVINLQQQQYSSTQKSQQNDNGTYQDPQNFNNYSAYQHHQQENNLIYATSHENAYNEGMMKMSGGGSSDYVDAAIVGQRIVTERKGTNGGVPQFHGATNQQQQNLIRRASQGSNISSSTGGSVPGFPVPCIAGNVNGHHVEHFGTPQMTPPIQQNGIAHAKMQQPQIHQQTAPPPPPPPPPPELKNALSGAKQQSFADQLRHVQLKRNNNNGTDTENCHSKSSPSAANANNGGNNNNNTQQMNGKPQGVGGNQDFISELADRLNKRKINVQGGSATGITNGSILPPPPLPNTANAVVAPNTSKNNANVHSTNCHKKIPSGTSLSSQEDVNSNNSVGIAATNTNNRDVIHASGSVEQQQNGRQQIVSADDLARLKVELAGMFSEELNKFKAEMTQIIRAEIAKLITQK